MSPEVSQKLKNNSKPAFGAVSQLTPPYWFIKWMFNYYEINLWEYLLLQLPSLLEFWMTKKNNLLLKQKNKSLIAPDEKTWMLKGRQSFPSLKRWTTAYWIQVTTFNHTGEDVYCFPSFFAAKNSGWRKVDVWFETRIGGWKKKPSIFWKICSEILKTRSWASRCVSIVLFKGVRHLIQTITFCQLLL